MIGPSFEYSDDGGVYFTPQGKRVSRGNTTKRVATCKNKSQARKLVGMINDIHSDLLQAQNAIRELYKLIIE